MSAGCRSSLPIASCCVDQVLMIFFFGILAIVLTVKMCFMLRDDIGFFFKKKG